MLSKCYTYVYVYVYVNLIWELRVERFSENIWNSQKNQKSLDLSMSMRTIYMIDYNFICIWLVSIPNMSLSNLAFNCEFYTLLSNSIMEICIIFIWFA